MKKYTKITAGHGTSQKPPTVPPPPPSRK